MTAIFDKKLSSRYTFCVKRLQGGLVTKQQKRLLIYFCIVVLFNLSANFVHPVTPTFIVERNLDSSMFGVALAAMMTCNFLFSPFWGKLCSYIPVKRILMICSFGYAIGQAVFCAAHTEALVIAGRMFAGVFTGGAFTALANYIINITPDPKQRAERLTIQVTIQNVAGAGGYFVGGMLGVISVEAAFIAQIVTLFLSGLLFLLLCEDDNKNKHIPEKPLSIREANPFSAFAAARSFMTPMLALVFIVIAVTSIGQNSFDQSFNYYIKDQFGLSSAYNGIFKAIIAIVTLAANATICVWLQRKTDTNRTILPVLLCCTISLGAILFFDTLVPFVAVDILFFAFNAIRLPLLQNICAMRSTAENSNQIMGFYQAMGSMGGIFGALFAGLIYKTNPLLPFILAFAAFAIGSAVAAVYVEKYKKAKA